MDEFDSMRGLGDPLDLYGRGNSRGASFRSGENLTQVRYASDIANIMDIIDQVLAFDMEPDCLEASLELLQRCRRAKPTGAPRSWRRVASTVILEHRTSQIDPTVAISYAVKTAAPGGISLR